MASVEHGIYGVTKNLTGLALYGSAFALASSVPVLGALATFGAFGAILTNAAREDHFPSSFERLHGNDAERERVNEFFENNKRSMLPRVFLGVVASLWQTASRPLVWGAMAAALAVDAAGYATKAVISVPLSLQRNGDDKVKEFFGTKTKKQFKITNTVRHLALKAKMIAPSASGAEVIRNNSLLSPARPEKAERSTYCDITFEPQR